MATSRCAAVLRSGCVALTVLALAGCAPGRGATNSRPSEAGAPTGPAPESPIHWLLRGPGAEALDDVPASTWPPATALTVAATCGPTDPHTGWTASGVAVPASDVPDGFDAGEAFDLTQSNGQRVREAAGEQPLRLIEQDDGRVDAELFVPDGEAPHGDAVDQAEVEFGPERCG